MKLKSKAHSLRGSLIGVSYNAEFYDNYGKKFFNVSRENIDIEGNVIEESGIGSDGSSTTNYTLSSVLTITIDGKALYIHRANFEIIDRELIE